MLLLSKVKTYAQLCGVAKALDVVGGRWTLLIVRNLLVGAQRYKDLLDTLPGITTNLLAERLQHMQAAGLITTRRTSVPAPATVYELTSRGLELEPVVLALGSFGAPYLAAPKRGDRRHVRWAMVSIKRRFVPEKLKRSIRLQFVVGGSHHYGLRGDLNGLHIQEAELEAPDARVELDEPAFMSLMFRGEPARALRAKNELAVTGDESALMAFLAAVSGVRVE
jgi:DNA-binding HxlR family transcriptional regulator